LIGPSVSSWDRAVGRARPATLFVVALIGRSSNVAAFRLFREAAPRFA